MKKFEYIIAYYCVATASILGVTQEPLHSSVEDLIQSLRSAEEKGMLHIPGSGKSPLSQEDSEKCDDLLSKLEFYRNLAKFDPRLIKKVRELEAFAERCPHDH